MNDVSCCFLFAQHTIVLILFSSSLFLSPWALSFVAAFLKKN